MATSPRWLMNIFWFVIGSLAGVLACMLVIRSGRATISKSVDTLQSENASLRLKYNQIEAAVANETAALNTCNAKFARATVLYDIGVLGGQTRAWVIPADIDPIAVGAKRGSYTHYDPKTQTETIQMQPKSQ